MQNEGKAVKVSIILVRQTFSESEEQENDQGSGENEPGGDEIRKYSVGFSAGLTT